jgi:hypothetical protein
MPIEIRPSGPPLPEKKKPVEEHHFPGKLCLLSILAMTGLYYHLIFVVPQPGADESSFLGRAVLAMGRCAEAHPVLLGAIFVGLLVPALAFPARARPYMARLAALLALLWAGTFTISSHPDAQAAQAVRSMLSTPRTFPETIHGR